MQCSGSRSGSSSAVQLQPWEEEAGSLLAATSSPPTTHRHVRLLSNLLPSFPLTDGVPPMAWPQVLERAYTFKLKYSPDYVGIPPEQVSLAGLSAPYIPRRTAPQAGVL